MAGLLDSTEIDITCPKCGRKTKKTIGWVKTHKKFTCICATDIMLDTSQLKTEIAKIEKSFSALESTIKKFGK